MMNAKETEVKIKELERKVATLEDLQAIMRLQRAYGFYLEHWMYQEVIDCFSDSSDTVLDLVAGIYYGKEGVKRYFSGEKARSVDPELLHTIMQLSGVVDVAKDGKTAAGRWFGFGAAALPEGPGVIQSLTAGVYTVEYIKEDGKWRIHKLMWNPSIMADPTKGWVKPDRLAAAVMGLHKNPRGDAQRVIKTLYPSGYIPPFHYPHPVTGKKTTERAHNKLLKIKGID
jgi:hypothetical protein